MHEPNPQKVYEISPQKRLITINLLVSAAVFESNKVMDIVALENLCHALDVFCLYDIATVLGHGGLHRRDWKSDFLDAFEEEGFVSHVGPATPEIKSIFRTASAHLAPALGISDPDNPDKFLHLFDIAWGAETFDISQTPDQAPRTEAWTTQLQEEREQASRQNTFVARTFLYLACADELGLALTPDVQRNPILAHAADQEELFRGRILQVLRQKYRDFFDGYGDPKLRGKVSPCAAIVFQEAKGKKSRIPWEMKRLRKELASTRENLRTLEHEILSNQDDPYKQQEAFNKWNKIVDDLERNYLKHSFWNVSAERKLLSFLGLASQHMQNVVGIIAQPHDPTKWARALSDLPLDVLTHSLRRRPLIDLYHALQPPSLLALRPLVVSLFGGQVLQQP
jgi:hypothetical protein